MVYRGIIPPLGELLSGGRCLGECVQREMSYTRVSALQPPFRKEDEDYYDDDDAADDGD